MEMAEVIRARLSALGKNQADLAEAIGVSERQVGRYMAGKAEPGVTRALDMADFLKISVAELAGGKPRVINLAGDWWASWQTYNQGEEIISLQRMQVHQEEHFLRLEAERSIITIEKGAYTWAGQLTLFESDTLMGWYESTDAAVRSKGTMFFKLHQHGLWAAGRWVGTSYDGDIVTGFGSMARDRDECSRVIRDLIDQPGDPWTRFVT